MEDLKGLSQMQKKRQGFYREGAAQLFHFEGGKAVPGKKFEAPYHQWSPKGKYTNPNSLRAAREANLFLIAHPDLPVLLKETGLKHNVSTKTLAKSVALIRRFYGLPKPKISTQGNIPFKAYEIIAHAYRKAKPKEKIQVLGVIQRIWWETGITVSVDAVRDNLIKMDRREKNPKGITVGLSGVGGNPFMSIAELREKLQKMDKKRGKN